ncbi:Tautomerase [Lasiodiplodia theobromae]|nr:Tautomerase [Lasiodiplodia theobromae]
MPLWLFFHPPGAFTDDESKRALSEDVTKIYTSIGLPAFYVVVQFIELPRNKVWVGGKLPEKPFIRVVIEHIAVRLPDEDDAYKRTTARVDATLKPHIADKGYDWEYHIDETDRRLWKINGLAPPAWKSEAEQFWFQENKPLSWEGKYEG